MNYICRNCQKPTDEKETIKISNANYDRLKQDLLGTPFIPVYEGDYRIYDFLCIQCYEAMRGIIDAKGKAMSRNVLESTEFMERVKTIINNR